MFNSLKESLERIKIFDFLGLCLLFKRIECYLDRLFFWLIKCVTYFSDYLLLISRGEFLLWLGKNTT